MKLLDIKKWHTAIKSGDNSALGGVGVYTKSNGFSPEIPDEAGANDLKLVWTISTSGMDRSKDVVEPTGWKFDNWIKGGSILWSHDPSVLPVAKPDADKPVWIEGNSVKSTAVYPERDVHEFGFTVYQLAKGGFIRGSSVGFIPLEWEEQKSGTEAIEGKNTNLGLRFTKQELLEWSHTPIPDNPEALLGAKSFGIDLAPLHGWATQVLDEKRDVPGVSAEAIRKAYLIGGNSPVSVTVPEQIESKEVSKEVTEDVAVAEEAAPAAEAVEEKAGYVIESSEDSAPVVVKTIDDLIKDVDALSGRVAALEDALKQKSLESEEVVEEKEVAKQVVKTVDSEPEVEAEAKAATPDPDELSEEEIAEIVKEAVAELVAENLHKL